MTKEKVPVDEKVLKKHPPEQEVDREHDQADRPEMPQKGISLLQQRVGNRAVQRLLAQRSSGKKQGGSFEVDEETAQRIEKERGGGQPLDRSMQEKMGSVLGHDFGDVRVHHSPEADALSQNLDAQAFTTGKDIFFRQGAYAPESGEGQELLAHELTHVVQQGTGMTGGGSKMTVNAPHDAYENSADAAAQQVVSSPGTIQAQENPEEEEIQTRRVQRQELDEEEEIQTKRIQRQEAPEEEALKKQELDEEKMKNEELEKEVTPEEEEEQQAWKVK